MYGVRMARNKKGPSTVPWGTPDVTEAAVEETLMMML